jgi:hypothetical protein
MVDPALRRGRFSVFAENIDPRTLARLRDEENAYLGVTPTHDVYPEQFSDDSVADVDFQDDLIHSDGLMDAPDDNITQLEAEAEAQAEASLWDVSTEDEVREEEVAAPEPDTELDADIDTGLDTGLDAGFDEGLDTGFSADVDADGSTDFVPDQDADESTGEEEEDGFTYLPDEAVASCTLTNPDTGETYHITGEHVFIGRGRSEGSVVLRDPNASRRHAELVWDQGGWFIHDLGSTNGTLVNDADVDSCVLRDGDIITLGLLNLEFRES